jgi:hypothetical protein
MRLRRSAGTARYSTAAERRAPDRCSKRRLPANYRRAKEVRMPWAAVVGSCIALLANFALAAPGDGLIVAGDMVNVRAGPGTEYRVRLQVFRQEPVVELARDGEWVQVELSGRGQEGWIHRSLLQAVRSSQPAATPATAGPETARSTGELALPSEQGPERAALPSMDRAMPEPASESDALARFRGNVDELNARARALAGVELFTGVEPAGSGTVEVLVTDAWRLVPEAGQESYTNVLFGHWRAAAGGPEPLRVQVVDPSGRVVSEKSGPARP